MSERAIDRIRRDLEQRGVAREFSAHLSRRLQPIVEPLDPEAYEAVLSSVSHACRAQAVQTLPEPDVPDPTSLRGLEEVQRLLGAFTDELQKLEEALETLAAYVTRMRSQTVHSRGQTLH
ncbi:MAG: hypothetical protein QNK05_13780 [Myxococcota bacterium]|nr:hypothetical protein [Myxococcota bacterium]